MRSVIRFCAFVFLAIALIITATSTSFAGLAAQGPSEVPVVGTDAPNVIPDRYIVVLKDKAPDSAKQAAIDDAVGRYGGSVHFVYSAALNGFAVTLPAKGVDALRANPYVDYIEADQVVSLPAPDADTAGSREAPAPAPDATQPNATWGLDRIDQRDLPLNTTYVYNYTSPAVHAYVIDTGIRITHVEFGGRAVHSFTAINDGNGANDCNGHGTHVSGTIGGATYGVAKAVRLHAVRVLNCSGSGTNSGVIAGVDWVTANRILPAVANMSLGGSASSALDTAVNNSINAGVTYAIAAGNSNANACNYSPARVAAAITVGSTTSTDARSSFSNYGTCLDIFAPGSSIKSAWNTSDTATNTISGTSMATPHVAGVAALYLESNPGASPATVRDALVNSATLNHISSPGSGSPNRLLYSLLGPPPPPPTPTPTPPPGQCPNASGGYCRRDDEARAWIAGSTNMSIISDDTTATVTLPFAFTFAGAGYTTVKVSSNGNIHFGTASSAYSNVAIPNTANPNALIAALWDDLNPAAGGAVYRSTTGTAPNRTFTVEWRGVPRYGAGTNGATFEIQLVEGTNHIWILYQDTDFGSASYNAGASATSGVENAAGTAGNQYSYNQAVLTNGKVLHFWPQ